MFSWFDLRVGLPPESVVVSPAEWSTFVPIFSLLGEPGVSGFCLVGEPMAGKSFIALSKTCGRSNAPGGWWLLLGLP